MVQAGSVRFTGMKQVIFGRACAEAVAGEAARSGAQKVFLMVSGSLRRESDHIDQAIAALGGRYAGLFDRMPAHSPREAVIEAASLARDAGCDLLVTIGGGSLTDAGKVVRLCLQHDVDTIEGLDDYCIATDATGKSVAPKFDGPTVPQIVVPTTLSGGEFNPLAGVTDSRSKVKQGYRHEAMIPTSVVLDPYIASETPEWLWLSTGIRAVDHAVEAICSPKANAYCDGAALHALRLMSRGLPASRKDPQDPAARSDCQIAAWLSMTGVLAGVPMGASHAIGHILGGTCEVPHGITSCIMLPYVLQYNAAEIADRETPISEALGRPGVPAATALHELIDGLDLPRRLSEVGITEEQFPLIAKNAMHDRWLHTNPRKIESEDAVLEILRMAA